MLDLPLVKNDVYESEAQGLSAQSLLRLEQLQLALLSGKGGVGKTTLSCAIAHHLAQKFPDQKVLLISTDPAHSLGDVLNLEVTDTVRTLPESPNLGVRALDAEGLLRQFRESYGRVLELLVERGSFVEGEELQPIWDLGFPGLDELMSLLEIQRILRQGEADRVVVDMAPSGHTLNLFGLMDFLDNFLESLELFQEKHRTISRSLTGQYREDEADEFLRAMKADLQAGRSLLQDATRTACWLVAITQPMSYLESCRFVEALQKLQIPIGGILLNRLMPLSLQRNGDACTEQPELLEKFLSLAQAIAKSTQLTQSAVPVFAIPHVASEPVGVAALNALFAQMMLVDPTTARPQVPLGSNPPKIDPQPPMARLGGATGAHLPDYLSGGQGLLIVGGKGGVGKTTVAAAIALHLAAQHPDRPVRVISIDPAHSLGDALGRSLGHIPTHLTPNLSAQEIDAEIVLSEFREEYLWELAEIMSGDTGDDTLQLAYGPQAWRQIVSQALPGIDEMLSLITVMELLEQSKQDLIVLDTAPTGHLLRFLEMPTALSDWLAWIFKLWLKHQDVVGRVEFMGRLRSLRQRVVQAQKKLKDPNHTEFIGVLQAQSAIVAEAERLTRSLHAMQISQRYIVQNCYTPDQPLINFEHQETVRLPLLNRAIPPLDQIQSAACYLFEG